MNILVFNKGNSYKHFMTPVYYTKAEQIAPGSICFNVSVCLFRINFCVFERNKF